MNNYLLREGVNTVAAKVKPPLTQQNKLKRYEFSRWILSDPDRLNKVVYFDEKLFNFRPTNNKVYIKCKKDEVYNEENIIHSKRPSQNTACNIGIK